jgi:hypothetical protein
MLLIEQMKTERAARLAEDGRIYCLLVGRGSEPQSGDAGLMIEVTARLGIDESTLASDCGHAAAVAAALAKLREIEAGGKLAAAKQEVDEAVSIWRQRDSDLVALAKSAGENPVGYSAASTLAAAARRDLDQKDAVHSRLARQVQDLRNTILEHKRSYSKLLREATP